MTRLPGTRGLLLALLTLILVSLVGVLTFRHLRHRRESAERDRRQEAVGVGPRVFVAPVELLPGQQNVTLPGDVRAFLQITLYAKVAGYLREIRVDKGEHVEAGQIIGLLESPETDQEVLAAQADLLVKQRAAERARRLAPPGVISAQELDNALGALDVSRANLERARVMQGYEVIRAPFAGVVTARYADPGALLPAAIDSTQSALPLVDLADLRRLRVTIFIGQDAASFVKLGDRATIVEDLHPEHRIEAAVSRLASALDPRSRTMLTEIWLDNARAHLYPGTFVHVTVHLESPPITTVPAEAVFSRGEQLYVAVVRDDQRLQFIPVETGLNDGRMVQILGGLRGGERVALSLPAELSDGARIQPVPRKTRPAPIGAGRTGYGGSGRGGSPGGAQGGGAGGAGTGQGAR